MFGSRGMLMSTISPYLSRERGQVSVWEVRWGDDPDALREDGDDVSLGEVDRQTTDVDVSRVFVLSDVSCIDAGQPRQRGGERG